MHEIYNILKKKMTFRAWLFPKLLSPKDVATETSRRSCFRTPFGNQRVNGFQTPLKVPRQHYYPFFQWIPRKLSWEKTALLWSKILRLFANTFSADEKYSCHNMQNFWQQFQTYCVMEDSFWIFFSFLKCAWNLQHFQKKDECPSVIADIIVSHETSRRSCQNTIR